MFCVQHGLGDHYIYVVVLYFILSQEALLYLTTKVYYTLVNVVGPEVLMYLFKAFHSVLCVFGSEAAPFFVIRFLHVETEESRCLHVHIYCPMVGVEYDVEGELTTFGNGAFSSFGDQDVINCL